MVVGFDMRPIFFTRGGISRYVLCLVEALSTAVHDVRVVPFCPKDIPCHIDSQLRPHLTPRILHFSLRNSFLETIWENLMLSFGAYREHVHLMHFPRFSVPLLRIGGTVVTVHDLAFRRYPHTLTAEARRYFESATSSAVKRADAIIAVSEHTRQDLIEFFHVEPDRVHVVYNGLEPRFSPCCADETLSQVRRAYGLKDDYILFVGTLEPRKNLVGLLNAYAMLRSIHGVDIPLVLAGEKGWLYEEVFDALHSLRLQSYVHLLGRVPDAYLPDLYRGASAFVYPSFYEGFGFPVLEAMACGAPVVTSAVSAIPEVAGDAALLVDPHSSEAIADALARILEDEALADDLRKRGVQQAARFSWDRAAKGTLKVYQACIG